MCPIDLSSGTASANLRVLVCIWAVLLGHKLFERLGIPSVLNVILVNTILENFCGNILPFIPMILTSLPQDDIILFCPINLGSSPSALLLAINMRSLVSSLAKLIGYEFLEFVRIPSTLDLLNILLVSLTHLGCNILPPVTQFILSVP